MPRSKTEESSRQWFGTRSYEYDQQAAARQGVSLTQEQWRNFIINMMNGLIKTGTIVWLCYIFHDRDPLVDEATGKVVLDEKGNVQLKGLHVHFLVDLRNAKSRSAVVAMFGLSDRRANLIKFKGAKNRTRWALYLTHSNQRDRIAGKYEYAIAEVFVWTSMAPDPEVWYRGLRSGKLPEDESAAETERAAFEWTHIRRVASGQESVADALRLVMSDEQVIEDLELGNSPRYGRELKATLLEASDRYKTDMLEYYATHHRCLESIYVQASGGLGKTEFARLRAQRKCDAAGSRLGYQLISAKGGGGLTFDPAGNYDGQMVSIANEFALSTMGLDQFKDMFDPINVTSVNSRNTDKVWFPSQFIATTSLDLEEQLAQMFMSWARTQKRRGAEVKGSGDNGRLTSVEWEQFYQAQPDMADQIRQVRRRIAVWVKIKALEPVDGKNPPVPYGAFVYVRDDAYNVCVLHFDGNGWLKLKDLPDAPQVAAPTSTSEQWTDAPVTFGKGLGQGLQGVPSALVKYDENGQENYGWELNLSAVRCTGERVTLDSDIPAEFLPGLDDGAWDIAEVVGYNPADPSTLERLNEAVDRAFTKYYALNGLTITPENTPMLPDLDAWRSERNKGL